MMAHVLMLIVAVLLAAPAQQATTATDKKPGVIRGRIVAAETGRPLRRVRVTIANPAGGRTERPIIVSTNSMGRFEAKDVPPGSYVVSARRAGYVDVQFGQRRVLERGLTVEVRSGETAGNIDLAMPRGSVVAGRIVDEIGEPYPGVRVEVLAMRYSHGRREPYPAGGATTNDLGEFRASGLAPGSYYVAAFSSETWRNEKGETFGYSTTYYPGTTADAAQMITLAPSADRTDITMTMYASRVVRIRGRVQRANAEPIGGAQVYLAYAFPGFQLAGGRGVRAERDGSFEFRDVAGGMYSISSGGGSSQMLTVGDSDVDGVILSPKVGSTVTGTFVIDDGTQPPFSPSEIAIVVDSPSHDVLPTVRVATVDRDWSFKFTNLGGPFLFRVRGLPPEWMLAAVRLGEKDITDTLWDAPLGGREISGLTIMVTRRIGRVEGVVVDAAGKPAPQATIVLFADDASLWTPGSRYIRTARPDANGRFTIAGLPGGNWRAIAREYVEDGQAEDRAFLEAMRDDAAAFPLADGGSHTLTLKIARP